MSTLKRRLQKLPAGILSILALLLTAWLTLAPHPLPEGTPSFAGADMVAHSLMFGGICVCFLLDRQRHRHWQRIGIPFLTLAFLLSTGLGILMEYIQQWMNVGRTLEVHDMQSDCAGALIASLLWYFLQGRWAETPPEEHEETKPEEKADGKNEAPAPEEKAPKGKKPKKHLVKSAWLRIPLKVLFWIIVFILLLPVLVYIPPVQTLLKDVACSVMEKSTGMKVEIDRFRIRFPLDVALDKVNIIEASGDTMVAANELIADVQLLPLLQSDVRVKRLRLDRGYYRMVSADSSMVMKIKAGLLDVSPGTSFNFKAMNLNIDRAKLKDADVALYMDVWKKKPQPEDTTSTPMMIKARKLDIENIRFGMSMLPTIDTLSLAAQKLTLLDGIIDLKTSDISAGYVGGEKGKVKYITPTPQYIATHPAPTDTISPPSPPMRIAMDSIALSGFDVLYATKGVKPAPGFDPTYISVTGLDIALKDFYNQASTISLPITRLSARERSGLTITQGRGTVSVDSSGISLDKLFLRTTASRISADASIPFALMEMKPDARMSVMADASLGLSDIRAFLPTMQHYLKLLPQKPIALKVDAFGSLSDLVVKHLGIEIPSTLSLFARGNARNPLDFKRMEADLTLDGKLTNPKLADKLLAMKDFNIPALSIKGTASVRNKNYTADIDLRTSAGNLAAKGHLALNSETYKASIEATDINVGSFVPDLGIGYVTASVEAEGAGFNPTKPAARTNSRIHISSIDYKGHNFHDIIARVFLSGGDFAVNLSSPNPGADMLVDATGNINGSDYTFDVKADVHSLDLQALGFSPTMANGSANFSLSGSANPDKWLYDVEFTATNLDWNMPDMYIHLPNGVEGRFLAENGFTSCYVDSDRAKLDFDSPTSLQALIDGFTKTADVAVKQVDARSLDLEALRAVMPKFDLNLNASGRGIVSQFLQPSGIAVDTIAARLSNDSIITGSFNLLGLNTGSLQMDTVDLTLKQRNTLLDYRAHIGNRPGTLDEFARVNLMGYAGGNRASLSITQHNIKNEMGYRVGLTAALADSVLTVHFTPLKATIAYIPWTVNADNHIDVDLSRQPMHITADLMARSQESSVMMKTTPNADGDEEFNLKLDNIHVEDFLRLSATAPPLTAAVSSDLHILYKDKAFTGNGTLNVRDFTYARQRVGDFDLDLDAGLDFNGNTRAAASLRIDHRKAITAHCVLAPDSIGNLEPRDVGLSLTRFPLSVANAFLGKDMAQLSGVLNGDMSMTGSFTKPLLNGSIACDSVAVKIPMMGSSLKFDNDPIKVTDNVIDFSDFNVWGANSNPIALNGSVNFKDFADILLDLKLSANNFQLINNNSRTGSDLYGKLFMTLNATARGSTSRLNVNGNVNILPTSDVTYRVNTDASSLTRQQASQVVTFVQFSDTTKVAKADSLPPAMAMRVNADLSITPGTRVTVILDGSTSGRVELQPSGSLNYFMNYMGDMRLSGQLNLGEGFAKYKVPVVGEKMFNFENGSYVLWNGDIMNPLLNIHAYDDVKVKVQVNQGGNTRPVTFKVALSATGTLSSPNVLFDLSTDDDLSIQNELSSMSADQRSTQAMNILLYGHYSGPGSKTAAPALGTSQLYSILESKINQWAAKAIPGVDLSFGIDQYDRTVDGSNSTSMSYSYQFSKSLFNNKFKIVVGGNYSTDASADENFSENLISDISFEYMLKQTKNLSMLVRLFRHTGWESVLEGEITETGVGFTMRRRLSNLKALWRFGRRKKNAPADTIALPADTSAIRNTDKTGKP